MASKPPPNDTSVTAQMPPHEYHKRFGTPLPPHDDGTAKERHERGEPGPDIAIFSIWTIGLMGVVGVIILGITWHLIT